MYFITSLVLSSLQKRLANYPYLDSLSWKQSNLKAKNIIKESERKKQRALPYELTWFLVLFSSIVINLVLVYYTQLITAL